jgi:RNA polymerase sigma-70 factor, ECF subfamily
MANDRDRAYWQWLAVRLQQGDTTAAEKLVEAFQQPLLFYLRRMLQSEDDAWDCAQETWISALRGLRRLRKPEAIAAYIYRIGRNHAWAKLRRRKITVSLENGAAIAADCSEEIAFSSTDAAAIRDALDRLSPAHRDILTLFFIDDLSVQEIADVLEIPRGTVKSRLFHSKRALRGILIKMGYSHER